MTGCVCTGPGFCERHRVNKTAHWVHLCQTKESYWLAWESGHGPGQKNPAVAKRRRSCGPGIELRKMLGCGCGAATFVAEMDRLGPDGCQERILDIVEWVCQRGCERSEPISPEAARRMITLAIERSRSVLAGAEGKPKRGRRSQGGLEQLPGADPSVGHAAEPHPQPDPTPDRDPPPTGPADDFLAGPVEGMPFAVPEQPAAAPALIERIVQRVS